MASGLRGDYGDAARRDDVSGGQSWARRFLMTSIAGGEGVFRAGTLARRDDVSEGRGLKRSGAR